MLRQRLYKGKFNRALFPAPQAVLRRLGFHPGKANYRGYWQLRCPFHKNGQEMNPSFNLHHIECHYRCHTCGVKGGDVLDFYIRITGASFIEAAISLGVWEKK